MATKKNRLHKDFTDLARIALTGRTQDVHVLLQRAIRRYKDEPALIENLTQLLRESPTRSSPLRKKTARSLPVDADSRMHLIRVEENPELDHEPVYSKFVRESLEQLVLERERSQSLLKAGLEPTRTVIFTGPPGVGKTLTARWLARELRKPLIILDLAAVMSSYLGRTGSNLRQVLDFAKSTDCVLLLDELDAIAKRRDDSGEVGELKRLVTVLIQEIDDWPASGLLIAATNHAELLDPAIWRRFEERIDFPLPNQESISRFVSSKLPDLGDKADSWAKIYSTAFEGKSYSDLERTIKTAKRKAALNGGNISKYLLDALDIDDLSKQGKIDLAVSLVSSKVLTQRAAHDLTGLARETIRKHVNVRGKK